MGTDIRPHHHHHHHHPGNLQHKNNTSPTGHTLSLLRIRTVREDILILISANLSISQKQYFRLPCNPNTEIHSLVRTTVGKDTTVGRGVRCRHRNQGYTSRETAHTQAVVGDVLGRMTRRIDLKVGAPTEVAGRREYVHLLVGRRRRKSAGIGPGEVGRMVSIRGLTRKGDKTMYC